MALFMPFYIKLWIPLRQSETYLLRRGGVPAELAVHLSTSFAPMNLLAAIARLCGPRDIQC